MTTNEALALEREKCAARAQAAIFQECHTCRWGAVMPREFCEMYACPTYRDAELAAAAILGTSPRRWIFDIEPVE